MNCCFPTSKLPPPASSIPLLPSRNDEKLEALFSKTIEELQAEYDEIKAKPKTPTKKLHFVFPKNQVLYAHHCAENTLILSQAPDKDSLNPFLKMLHEKANAVIILLQIIDLTRRPEWQLEPYFTGESELKCDYDLSVEDLPQEVSYIKNKQLEISPKGNGSPKRLPIHHYNDWPDNKAGTPKHIAMIARIAMDYMTPVIHCVGGVGRAGTLAAVISAYRRIKKGNHEVDVIKNAVHDLRKERPGAVFRFAQYQSVYEAIKILLEQDNVYNYRLDS
ncbi:MAG: hypothetical protein COT85_02910 [Chlamydiae bacterium CG10_big_fil_rev_8_21_14_0_10_42_34]|nr:MAG: hypothetical protein COT85_02910 [Chlamydiae bacterium CG10_big_fil_rev_8_21_14_0_10_42_34]